MSRMESDDYIRGLNDAIEIAKGHHSEYLTSCHHPKLCEHWQTSLFIRERLTALRDGKITLEQAMTDVPSEIDISLPDSHRYSLRDRAS